MYTLKRPAFGRKQNFYRLPKRFLVRKTEEHLFHKKNNVSQTR